MRRIFVLAIVFAAMAWLWRAMESAREDARFSQCYGDFKSIGLALHNYQSDYGSLPPAYLTDAKGRPTLSWRVIVLPYMGRDSIYKSFNLSEPWDSPTNIKLLGKIGASCQIGAGKHGATPSLIAVGIIEDAAGAAWRDLGDRAAG